MNYFNFLPSAVYLQSIYFFAPSLTVQHIQIEQSHYGKHIGSFYFKCNQCLAANKLSIFHPISLSERQKKEKDPFPSVKI